MENLFILEQHRKKGYGKVLIEKLMELYQILPKTWI